jgi:hypothetical protein
MTIKSYYPVTRKSAVRRNQSAFQKSVRRVFDDTMDLRIQTPGAPAYTTQVRITPSKVWSLHWLSDKGYFYQPFGQVTRSPYLSHSPYVEVNVPEEGENLRVASVFATPNTGRGVYLIHTGKIGGGKKNVGKKKFLAWLWKHHRNDVAWCKLEGRAQGARAIQLGRVGTDALVRSIIDFMYLTDEFKRSTGAKTATRRRGRKKKGAKPPRSRRSRKPVLPAKTVFNGEGYPLSTQRMGAKRVTRHHGKVVEDLKRHIEQLHKQQNVDVGNTEVVDLYTTRRPDRKLLQVFEVKTSFSTQAIYTAIGQLLVYSAMKKGVPARRSIVLPVGCEEVVRNLYAGVFDSHEIQVLTYAKESGSYRFATLELYPW